MNEQSLRWLTQAHHDLDAAKKNQVIELYDVALVLCQQALEKALKALYEEARTEASDDDHK